MTSKEIPYGKGAVDQFLQVIEAADRMLQDRNRLQNLLDETAGEIPGLRRKLETATKRLDHEASAESASAPELRAARKTVTEGQEEIEVAEARVRGLTAKVARFAGGLIEASGDASTADSEFKQAVLADFRESVFLPAVAAFKEVLEESMAVMRALELDVTCLLESQAFDIQGVRIQMLDRLQFSESIADENMLGGTRYRTCESWQASPEKVKVFESYRALREPLGRLKQAAQRAIDARPIPIEAPRTVVRVTGE